jgi:hypothetical protein
MSFHLNELPAPVSPDDVASDFFPLSFAQERLWFLDELDPGQTSYQTGRQIPPWASPGRASGCSTPAT